MSAPRGGAVLARVAAEAAAWREAEERAAAARARLIAEVRHANGTVGERRIAEAAGVQRGTVRAWLGR